MRYQYNAYGTATHAGVPGAGWPNKTGMYVTGTEIDELGRITGRTMRHDNTSTTEPQFVRTYSYDAPTGALQQLKASWSTGGLDLQDVTYNRDPIGNVTSIFDNVNDTKECFLYDSRNRLIRAHTTAATANQGAGSGTCLTTTTAQPLAGAARGVGGYDQVYEFDQINRLQAKTDKYTNKVTDLDYLTNEVTQPHAVSKVTVTEPATTTVESLYTYNANGTMDKRAGVTLQWDKQQRLTNYNNGAETYTYWTSNQRVQRTGGGTRTIYLPGLDITIQGPNRTITKQITIDGAVVATTKTGASTGKWWNCADMQNSTTCQAPIGGGALQTHRYLPYGEQRTIPGSTPITTTDRGFLNQPEDTTGLVYLNNRYHDPALAAFVSVDPLVGKTGTPYLYGNGNPTTLTDPSGLCQTFGVTADGKHGGSYDDGAVCDAEARRAIANNTNLSKMSDEEAARYLNNHLIRDHILGQGMVPSVDALAGRDGCFVVEVQVIMPCSTARELGYSTGNEDEYVREVFDEWVDNEVVPAAEAALLDIFLAWGFSKLLANGSIWKLGPTTRGLEFEEMLRRSGQVPGMFRAGNNVRVIDAYSEGVATSIKSLDLAGSSVNTAGRLASRLTGMVDDLAAYSGNARSGGITVGEVTARQLIVGIPTGTVGSMQVSVLSAVRAYAHEIGVEVTYVLVP